MLPLPPFLELHKLGVKFVDVLKKCLDEFVEAVFFVVRVDLVIKN